MIYDIKKRNRIGMMIDAFAVLHNLIQGARKLIFI